LRYGRTIRAKSPFMSQAGYDQEPANVCPNIDIVSLRTMSVP
jgi:hypothetical protein